MTKERRFKDTAGWVRARLWLLLGSLLAAVTAQGAGQIELLLSDDSPAYRELAGAFQAELGLACAHRCATPPSVRVSTVATWRAADPRDLLVTAGNEAAVHAVASHPPSLLYGLVPMNTWQALSRLHPRHAGQTSAVYLEQPVARQLDLLRIVLPAERRRIGVLLGPDSSHLAPHLRDQAARRDMVLVERQIHSRDEVGPAMESLAGEIDLLLALPDALVFNPDTLYGILLTSYGAGIPVAGYSSALAEAGAMLALYTSIPNMARHLARVSADYLLDGGDLPEPVPSDHYEIAVNRNVARSLGYELPDAAELQQRLRSLGDGQ